MRYALISDIHANLPALEAVLNSIAARPEIDATYHLGDLVGYGPWPNETISLLKGFRIPGIQGNHDDKIARSGAPAPMRQTSRSVTWSGQRGRRVRRTRLFSLGSPSAWTCGRWAGTCPAQQ